MIFGTVLTSAPSLQWLDAFHAGAPVTAIKAVTRWGLPWSDELRRAVLHTYQVVLLRTAAGDQSYLDGAHAYPIAEEIAEEIQPWWEQRDPGRRLMVEVGNEPLLEDTADANSCWRYCWHLRQTVTRCRERFPGIYLIHPAQMMDHWVRLGDCAEGQRRWMEIAARDTIPRFDGVAIHAYSPEQIQRSVAVLDGLKVDKPIWLTEFGLNLQLAPAARGAVFSTILARFPQLRGAFFYHIAETAGESAVHFNPNYRLQRQTLRALRPPDPFAAWGSKVPLAPQAQRFRIPQTWLEHPELGEATSPEIYLGRDYSAQAFAGGIICYAKATGTCHVVPLTRW